MKKYIRTGNIERCKKMNMNERNRIGMGSAQKWGGRGVGSDWCMINRGKVQ